MMDDQDRALYEDGSNTIKTAVKQSTKIGFGQN